MTENLKRQNKKDLLQCILLNLCFIFICAILFFIVRFLPKNNYAAIVFKITCFIVFQLFELTACGIFYTSNYSAQNKKEKKNVQGIAISALKLSIFIPLLQALRFFLQKENITGNVFAGIVLFIFFFCRFSLFWFFTELQNSEKKFFCNIKVSFQLFILFPFFTFKVFLKNILYVCISCFTFFIFPGICGIIKNKCISYKNLKKHC